MIRQAAFAGQFYPASANKIRAMIKEMVDEKAGKEDVIGAVIPHAGYIYSGPVVGAVLSRIKFRDTFVIMCPNHTGLGKLFSLWAEDPWSTPLGQVDVDSELAERILAESHYLEKDKAAHMNEHAIEVQLPFLQYFKPDVKIVPIVLGQGGASAYKEIGRAIARAIKALKREAIVIASSDMTHYEPQESASNKDSKAIQAMVELNEDKLLKAVQQFDITMCGYAAAVSLISAAKELGASHAELVKYQTSGDGTGDYSSVVGYAGIIVAGMSAVARLAKETVETYVKDRKLPKVAEADLSAEMKERAGVFVSIHKHGELRGCIGTFEPQRPNVAEEIISNAVSSATRDPRFFPIGAQELKDLEYSVDVLTHPVPVEDKDKLDPKKYGVIVECGWRKGLLLPDLEGVDTVDQQIDICCQKAGISPGEKTNLYRFEVRRYK